MKVIFNKLRRACFIAPKCGKFYIGKKGDIIIIVIIVLSYISYVIFSNLVFFFLPYQT